MSFSLLKSISIACLLCLLVSCAEAQDKLFRLVLIDPPRHERPLPQDAGFELVVSGDHLNHVYYASNGELRINIPPATYRSGHIRLVFRGKQTDFIFMFSRDSIVDLSLDPATVQEIRFVRKTANPFNQALISYKKLDSLELAQALFERFTQKIGNYALLSAADKVFQEKAFTEAMTNSISTAGYSKVLAAYFKNRELIRMWVNMKNDFRGISSIAGPHAFYEALFLQRQKDAIQYFCKLLTSANPPIELSLPEKDNLFNINNFLLSPETASPQNTLDTKQCYNTIARYVSEAIRERQDTVSGTGDTHLREPGTVDIISHLNNEYRNTLFDAIAFYMTQRGRLEPELRFLSLVNQSKTDSLFRVFFPETYRILNSNVNDELYSTLNRMPSIMMQEMTKFPNRYHDWLASKLKDKSTLPWVALDNIWATYGGEKRDENSGEVNVQRRLLSILAFHLRDGDSSRQLMPTDNLSFLDGIGQKYFIFLLNQYAPVLFKILDQRNNYRGFADTSNTLSGMLNRNTGYFLASVHRTLDSLHRLPVILNEKRGFTNLQRRGLARLYTDTYLNFFYDNMQQRNTLEERNYERKLIDFFEAGSIFSDNTSGDQLEKIEIAFETQPGFPSAEMRVINSYYKLATAITTLKTIDQIDSVLNAFFIPPKTYAASREWAKISGIYCFPGLIWEPACLRPAVPLGMAFTRKTGTGNRTGAWFLYTQLLDLANPFSYDLKERKFGARMHPADLLLPAVTAGYGLKNSPVVFSIGGSYNDRTSDNRRALTLQFGLSYDFPIWWLKSQRERTVL